MTKVMFQVMGCFYFGRKFRIVSVIFILIAVSLVMATGFLILFLWSVKDGQYEDDYTPSVRMLFDNELKETNDIGKP